MKIIIGADHGGYDLKEKIKRFLTKKGLEFEDAGALSMDPQDDYTDFAIKVAKKVGQAETRKEFQEDIKGLLLCRTAAGMVIAANKIKGARAVAAFDEASAKHSREHNASNILALSGDWLNEEKAKKVLEAWIETPFSREERHVRRLKKITKIET